jgi:hypothetical protein
MNERLDLKKKKNKASKQDFKQTFCSNYQAAAETRHTSWIFFWLNEVFIQKPTTKKSSLNQTSETGREL